MRIIDASLFFNITSSVGVDFRVWQFAEQFRYQPDSLPEMAARLCFIAREEQARAATLHHIVYRVSDMLTSK